MNTDDPVDTAGEAPTPNPVQDLRTGNSTIISSAAFAAADLPMVVLDQQYRVVHVNAAGARLAMGDTRELLGSPAWQILLGQGDGQDAGPSLADVLAKPAAGPERRRAGGRAGRAVAELLWVGPLGDRRRFVWTFTPLGQPHQGSMVAVGVDVTEHRKNEAVWRQLAQTDPLTGLANRAVVQDALTDHLHPHRGLGCGLLFCDLDGFKLVNDTHGHAAGDQLLIQTGQRLAASVRQGDLVARVGGDEFVVLLPAAGVIETRAAATRVERAVARPIRLDIMTVRVGVSVGHRVAEVGEDPQAVLGDADAAMYAIKARRARVRALPAS